MAVIPSMSWNGVVLQQRQGGRVSGIIDDYRWEAYVAREPVSYGLNPQNLYKGRGRVVRLVLFVPVIGGRLWRKVASYNRGWLFGRKAHLRLLARVVAELEQMEKQDPEVS